MAEQTGPIPVSPDELIKPASNSLSVIMDKDPLLKRVEEDVPPIHRQFVESIKTGQGPARIVKEAKFQRGNLAYDKEKTEKVVVTKLVGYSLKGTPMYRVTQPRTGESWIQIEKKLGPR